MKFSKAIRRVTDNLTFARNAIEGEEYHEALAHALVFLAAYAQATDMLGAVGNDDDRRVFWEQLGEYRDEARSIIEKSKAAIKSEQH